MEICIWTNGVAWVGSTGSKADIVPPKLLVPFHLKLLPPAPGDPVLWRGKRCPTPFALCIPLSSCLQGQVVVVGGGRHH